MTTAIERHGWSLGEIQVLDKKRDSNYTGTTPRDPHGMWVGGGGGFHPGAGSNKPWAIQREAKIKAAPKPTKEDIAHNAKLLQTNARPGGDFRGSSADRAARTQHLLDEFGNGKTCPCSWCGRTLNSKTLSQDKIYTVRQGGRYKIANLLPACLPCNQARGDKSIVH